MCPNLLCKPVNQREDPKCFISHTPRQLQCTNTTTTRTSTHSCTHAQTIQTHRQETKECERESQRGIEREREHSNNLTRKCTHTKRSTSSQGHLHSLESKVDLGLSPWVSSQPKGNMMARYWLFHCLPNNCILEYMQYDAVTCAD